MSREKGLGLFILPKSNNTADTKLNSEKGNNTAVSTKTLWDDVRSSICDKPQYSAAIEKTELDCFAYQ